MLVMVRRVLEILPLLALSGITGCGELDSKGSLQNPATGTVPHLGCLQGAVVDGLTGKSLALTGLSLAKGEGIRVMIGDTTLVPRTLAGADADQHDMAGRYTLCDVPLDEDYPVVVNVPGYQRVEGVVHVSSTSPAKSAQGEVDVIKQVPMEVINVRLYPVGVQTADLKFVVTHEGLPQKDAEVILVPTGGNTLDVDHFLVPLNINPKPMSGKTDEKGAVVFSKDQLTLGAEMTYRVIPATTDIRQTIANGKINVGLLTQGQTQFPYLVYVDLKNPLPALAIVSSSLDSTDYRENGELILHFNREIELVPGTEDNVHARLEDVNGAQLVLNVPGNGKPDQVAVTIEGNVLKLAPVYQAAPDKIIEGGAKIVYSGISLRPKMSPGTADLRQLEEMKVTIFGGVTPDQIASVLGAAADAGDGQTGKALADLPNILQVLVADQFGRPFKGGYDVTFTVTTGNGTVREPNTTSGGASYTVKTDGLGIAKAQWKLGIVTGEQKLTVSATGMTSVSFSAMATAVPTFLTTTRGGTQSANAQTDVIDPLEVQVLDQNQQPLKGGTQVRFAVVQGSGVGTIRRTDGTGSGSSVLDLTTSADDGKASVLWTLGLRSGNQQVVATYGNMTATFNGTALAVLHKIGKLNGDNFQVPPGIDQELIVQLRDQEDKDFRQANRIVTFRLAVGAGALRLPGATAPGTATELSVPTDTDGRAKVLLQLSGGVIGTSFQVRIATDGVPADAFSGTVKAKLNSATIVTGAAQLPVAVSTDVADPFSVQLRDQDGNEWKQAGVSVTFRVNTVNAGSLRRALLDPVVATQTELAVTTDANGRAAVYMRTGTTAVGAYEVQATVVGFPVMKFTGTVQ